MNYTDLKKNEQLKYDIIEELHECSWWKRIKSRKYPKDFKLKFDTNSGIRKIIIMECINCGKLYNITDYKT
jgi:hypothetical protein